MKQIKTEHFITRYGWALTLATLCCIATMLPEPLFDSLRYQRQAVEHGEIWRLLSAAFLHTNHWHLLMNIAGLLLIVSLAHTSLTGWRLPVVVIACNLASSTGILLLYPSVHWFVGLSGALHGVILYLGIREFSQDRLLMGLVILLTAMKIGYESIYGGNPLTASQIQARVLVEGHLTGAVGGVLLGIVVNAVKRSKR